MKMWVLTWAGMRHTKGIYYATSETVEWKQEMDYETRYFFTEDQARDFCRRRFAFQNGIDIVRLEIPKTIQDYILNLGSD